MRIAKHQRLPINSLLVLSGLAGLALGQEPPDTATEPVYRAFASVVSISGGGGLVGTASGNGFFVDDSGVIATDLNLVKGAESVSARDSFGKVAYFPRIVGYDEDRDLVVLRFPDLRFDALPLGDPDAPAVDDTVFAVGRYSSGTTVDAVRITSVTLDDDRVAVIRHDTAMPQRAAGSPLLTRDGNVIGILKYDIADIRRGVVTPIDSVEALLETRRDISLEELNDELGLSDLMSDREPRMPAEAFALETRAAAWAAPLERSILATLAETPGLALSSVQVECRETVCRVQLVSASGEDFRGAHDRLRGLGLELRVEAVTEESGVRSVDYTLFRPRDNAFGEHGSQLEEAIEQRADRIAIFLVESGSDLDQRYYIGWTPLSRAAQYGNLPVVRALLAAGADPGIADDEGRTPLDQATVRAEGYASGAMDPSALGPDAEQRIADYFEIVRLLQEAR